jgi:hypothetical protein
MTLVSLVLLGLGVLLIFSAIEGCSILNTLQNILAGKTVDLAGKRCQGA